MRFRELTEAFDKPFDYKISTDGYSKDPTGEFTDSAGKEVVVRFEFWAGPEICFIDFARAGKWDMTNDTAKDKNEAVRIMSTVIAIMKEVIGKHKSKWKFLAYSVKDGEVGRGKLYDRLVKRMGSQFGYAVIDDPTKIDHPVLPRWWVNKLKQTVSAHKYILLGRDEVNR